MKIIRPNFFKFVKAPSIFIRCKSKHAGFTLIELLVVLAIVALLLTLAMPRYFQSIDTSKDAILRDNLRITRDTIDKFYGDTGRYPKSLDELVEKKYLRALPLDPITDSTATWVIVPPDDTDKGNVYSIKSGAPGNTKDGKPYADF
ncbi:MAG: type II secretion system protein [Burkholderiaceae bacterium]